MAADRTESTPALRTPTPQEQTELGIAVEDLAWQWARRLGATAPRPFGHNTDPVLDAGAAQATAQALRLIASTAETWSLIHTTTAQGPGPAARPAPGPGEWTREQVLAHLAEAGMPVAPDTWSAYVSRGQAPAPLRRVGRTPVWDPADVRAWQDGRRGRGWRAGTGGRTRDTVAGELDAARARHRDALHAVHATDPIGGREAARARARAAADDVGRLTRELDEIDLAAMSAGLDDGSGAAGPHRDRDDRDIRELAGALDTGDTVPDGLAGAVRAGVRDLLARVTPTPAATSPAEDRAPAVPTPETRSSRDDREVASVRSRRRAPRPVVVRGETGDHQLSAELSAAVRAVHAAGPDDQPVLTVAEGGLVTVTLGGVLLGTVGRAPYGHRGWQARGVGGVGLATVWRAGRMQDTHPTRKAAAAALVYELALLADRARRATLRTP